MYVHVYMHLVMVDEAIHTYIVGKNGVEAGIEGKPLAGRHTFIPTLILYCIYT